jgi:hypothetical protein
VGRHEQKNRAKCGKCYELDRYKLYKVPSHSVRVVEREAWRVRVRCIYCGREQWRKSKAARNAPDWTADYTLPEPSYRIDDYLAYRLPETPNRVMVYSPENNQ